MQRNKWEFFVFLVLEVLAMLITGGFTLTSMWTFLLLINFLFIPHFFSVFKVLVETHFLCTGILTNPFATPSFGGRIQYALTHLAGATSFLIVDFFLFFGVFVLTVLQANQVRV